MNNCLICTSSVVEISVKPDELYQRYVFMDEYEITKRKYLFFKKNIKIIDLWLAPSKMRRTRTMRTS